MANSRFSRALGPLARRQSALFRPAHLSPFLSAAHTTHPQSTCSTRQQSFSSSQGRQFSSSLRLLSVPLDSASRPNRASDFAFAFDIDGVLLRASNPIPGAAESLRRLQKNGIPFILLTNGGGKSEAERVEELSEKLGVQLDTSLFVQSHTPFALQDKYKDKTCLVVGGDGDRCRKVAESYGFQRVVTPGDIYMADPSIWPFSSNFASYYSQCTRPLPTPLASSPQPSSGSLCIDGAIFVFNDPRDWGLDATLIVDLLLSSRGTLGTLSSHNGDTSLPNNGYQQDGQPPLYFCNPDLWWAAKYHLPRLGQGGFREALEGLWAAVTQSPKGTNAVELKKTLIGKPHQLTYEFAETMLLRHRQVLLGQKSTGSGNKVESQMPSLKTVYMVGDNPESDIAGGNGFKSPNGVRWRTALVRTGVYTGGKPAHEPSVTVESAADAVDWALRENGFD